MVGGVGAAMEGVGGERQEGRISWMGKDTGHKEFGSQMSRHEGRVGDSDRQSAYTQH